MCRIVAYYGSPLTLARVFLEPPHSLEQQSHSAREMDGWTIAGDGWGAGWLPRANEEKPGMIKSILPLWADLNAKTVLPAIESRLIVGHIRHASPSVEVCFTNTPLFIYDDVLITMNGEMQPWPGALSRALRARLADEDEAALQGTTDAEMLAALWRTHRRRGGGDIGEALCETLREAAELALRHDGSIKANVIIANHAGVTAARFGEPDKSSSLYYLAEQERWNQGVLIASEPLDNGSGWQRVKPNTLVRATPDGVTLEEIEHSQAYAKT